VERRNGERRMRNGERKGHLQRRNPPLPEDIQGSPGDHTWLVTPVPIPNTAVKQPGPMVVATAARVGHRRVYQTPAGASQRALVFLEFITDAAAAFLGSTPAGWSSALAARPP